MVYGASAKNNLFYRSEFTAILEFRKNPGMLSIIDGRLI